MGFDEVELVLAGHNFFPYLRSPQGLHYEDWYERAGGGALDEQQQIELGEALLEQLDSGNGR